MPRKPPGDATGNGADAPAEPAPSPRSGLRLFGINITAPVQLTEGELRRLGETRARRRSELSAARYAVLEAERALLQAEDAADRAERAFAAAVASAYP